MISINEGNVVSTMCHMLRNHAVKKFKAKVIICHCPSVRAILAYPQLKNERA